MCQPCFEYNVDSFGNVYFPMGISVKQLDPAVGVQTKVLVPGPNGKLMVADVSQLGISGTGVETDPTVPAHVKAITTNQIAQWSEAYSRRILAVTSSGTSGPSTFINGTLNIPQYSGGGGGSVEPINVYLHNMFYQ